MFSKLNYFIIIVFIASILLSLSSKTYANSGERDSFSDVMELELIQQVQNPRTLEYEFTLRLRSKLNTNRVRVNWEIVNGLSLPAKGIELTDSVEAMSNQDIYITKKFVPVEPGFEEIRINVTVFGTENDYFNFIDEEFFINESLEINPDNETYQTSKLLNNISQIIRPLLVVFLVFFSVANLAWLFKKWLNKE